ncbi:MAG: serine hydrolase [Anaerolineales bacterium]|nr:serine hydrolase [Anaerolineales bacterium]
MRRNGFDLQRWVSIFLLLAAAALFFIELVSYSRERTRLPDLLTVAGIPVGGITPAEAMERLLQAYSTPVELSYDDESMLLMPASVGFRLDTDVMIAAAERERTDTPFWEGFWDFLWNRPGDPASVPLQAEYSSSQLEAYLQDVAARYDQPPIPPEPIPGTTRFTSGEPGRVLDIARAENVIGAALQSPRDRKANLPVVNSDAPKASLNNLEILLKQNIEVTEFDGLVDLYLRDIRTGGTIHFAVLDGVELSTNPDIAFSAASIIKISIMTTFFRYEDQPLDPEAERWVTEMITESGNDPSDWLMQRIDEIRGPLVVSETMQELGLENTFIAGYYYPRAPLLQTYRTPANSRTDIDTGPDRYTQTTPSEMGTLLGDIYACANGGGGALIAAFPDEFTPEECRTMLELLSENVLGSLLKGGVPDGTRVAHKHGWRSSPLDMVGDAGIVFSPGGDYILSVFVWDDQEMVWEPTSRLIADLSRAAYNYFNPPTN